MSTRVYFNRIGGVLLSKIESEIKAIYAQIDGVASDPSNNRVGVDFIVVPSAQVQTQIQTAILAHDPTDLEEQSRVVDYADLLAMAEAGLTQIANDQMALLADITALAAATTLPQVKPIVSNMLTRQQHGLNMFDKIIKVLRHTVKG